VLLELWDSVRAGRGHLVLVPYGNLIMIKGQAVTVSDFMISPDCSSALVLYVAINCPEPIQILSDYDDHAPADQSQFFTAMS
jgi:hypothetical protein